MCQCHRDRDSGCQCERWGCRRGRGRRRRRRRRRRLELECLGRLLSRVRERVFSDSLTVTLSKTVTNRKWREPEARVTQLKSALYRAGTVHIDKNFPQKRTRPCQCPESLFVRGPDSIRLRHTVCAVLGNFISSHGCFSSSMKP